MQHRFLLITSQGEDRWAKALQESLAGMGSLVMATEEKARLKVEHGQFSVIIIDSSAVEDAVRLTGELLKLDEQTRVVVATHSPTWKRAREALQAGALDYLPKTMVREDLRKSIQRVLQIPAHIFDAY